MAAESLGLPAPFTSSPRPAPAPAGSTPAAPPPSPTALPAASSSQDIKSFVAVKNPHSDVQFVATVAYYYQFVAPASEKRQALTKDHLLDAFRKVGGRRIPPHPEMTLNNAYMAGLLDWPEKGKYAINSVGENLVTMTLPGDGSAADNKRKPTKKPVSGKKATRKKTPSKAKS